MKPTMEAPSDLDYQAKKKWEELVGSLDVDADGELLGNYCRQHSSLMAIRREKRKQQKSGKFKTMVPARDGTKGLNPLLVTENRLIASLNRMLKGLGLTPSKESSGRVTILPTPPPPGFPRDAKEPKWGWTLEAALCKGKLDPTPKELEQERLRDEWLAARRNQGGKYGTKN
jgi:hypothetical protein